LHRRVEKAPAVSEVQRELVATRIAEAFNRLPPDKKHAFVDDTLTTLVNMTREQMRKMFSSLFWKKGRPSTQDLETINQLIVVFTFSIKPEFQHHYASMIYKSLRVPIPPDLPEKLEEVRKLKWIHAGISPAVYDKLYAEFEKYGDYDEFFTELLNKASSK